MKWEVKECLACQGTGLISDIVCNNATIVSAIRIPMRKCKYCYGKGYIIQRNWSEDFDKNVDKNK